MLHRAYKHALNRAFAIDGSPDLAALIDIATQLDRNGFLIEPNALLTIFQPSLASSFDKFALIADISQSKIKQFSFIVSKCLKLHHYSYDVKYHVHKSIIYRRA